MFVLAVEVSEVEKHGGGLASDSIEGNGGFGIVVVVVGSGGGGGCGGGRGELSSTEIMIMHIFVKLY